MPNEAIQTQASSRAGFFLIGPTAVGKTSVAHILARRLSRAVLSADSMMVYRGMDIGTAKPTASEIFEHRYSGLDLCDPDHDFSVGEFVRAIPSGSPELPIVCGGTGLYIRCLTEGLRELPAADATVRARAEQLLADGGVAALQAELRKVAPEKLARLADPQNPRRLIRALETAGAETSSDWKTVEESKPVLVGMRMERPALEVRIRSRVESMYADGLTVEADALRQKFPTLSQTARQAIGYAEAFAVLNGELKEDDAKELTVIRTRQLAKRQMTWFRRQHRVEWVDVAENDFPETIADKVQSLWNQYGPTPFYR